MFRESRRTGSIGTTLSAQEVLTNAPWLWAFNRLWAEGICCETGSIHAPHTDVFSQRIDGVEDSIYEVFFLMIEDGIWQVKQVPKLMRFAKSNRPMDFSPRDEPNPEATSGNIAERIVAALQIPSHRILEKLRQGTLVVPQVVIRGPGPVDRTSHYHIYQRAPFRADDGSQIYSMSILPWLLDSHPDFAQHGAGFSASA